MMSPKQIRDLKAVAISGSYNDLSDKPNALSMTNVIFIDVLGNDTTGDGSISKPFASLYHAMNTIVDATPTKRYVIKYGIGFFTETQNIVHKPNVWVMGDFAYTTRVVFSGTYSLDSSFAGSLDNRFGFINIYIDGILNVDMFAVTATNARMYNRGCQFNKAITFKAYAASSRFYTFFCETFSTLNTMGGYVHGMGSVYNGLVTCSSLPLTSCSTIFSNSYLPNGLTVNNPLSTEYIDVWLMNTQIRSSFTVTGWSGIHYSFGCLPTLAERSIATTVVMDPRGNESSLRIVNPRITVNTSPYYATNLDYIIAVTSTAVPMTVFLPTASFMNEGSVIIIKDESGLASVNNITIQRSSTDTIEGVTSKVINTNYGMLKLYKGSTGQWFVMQ
jgi:hypothetical protein